MATAVELFPASTARAPPSSQTPGGPTSSLPRSQSDAGRPTARRQATLSTPTPPPQPAPPSFLTYTPATTARSARGLAELAGPSMSGSVREGGASARETDVTLDEEAARGAARPSRSGYPLVHSRTMPLSSTTTTVDRPGQGTPLRRSRKESLPADYWARARRDSGQPVSSDDVVDGGRVVVSRQSSSSSSSAAAAARRRRRGTVGSASVTPSSALLLPGAPGGCSTTTTTSTSSSPSSSTPTSSSCRVSPRPPSPSPSPSTLVGSLEAKIVLLGSPSAGKTSIIQRFTARRFTPAPPTVGTGLSTRKQLVDGVHVRLQLWDAAGQERYRSIAPVYYRGAHVAILVYDTTRRASLDELRSWLGELRDKGPADVVLHVVGAKADLIHEREVDLPTVRRELRSWLLPSTSSSSASTPTASSTCSTARAWPPARSTEPEPTPTPTPAVRPSLALLPPASRLTFSNPLARPASTLATGADGSSSASSPAPTEEDPPPGFFFSAAAAAVRARRRSGDWASGGFGMDPPRPAPAAAAGGGQDEGGRGRRKSEEWTRRREAGGLGGAGGAEGGPTTTTTTTTAGAVAGGKRGVSFKGVGEAAEGERDDDDDDGDQGLEGIGVWETSASTSQGIEPLFLHITRQLIARGDALERERLRKARESVVLDDDADADDGGADGGKVGRRERRFGGGCCA